MTKLTAKQIKYCEMLDKQRRHHRPYSVDLGKEKLTDQSMKNACDINCIIERYRKTGMLPHMAKKVEQYLDVSLVPSFELAHDLVVKAREEYEQLPAIIRNAMGNDPRNLASFVSDPSNKEMLIKYGLFIKKEEPKSVPNSFQDQGGVTTPDKGKTVSEPVKSSSKES